MAAMNDRCVLALDLATRTGWAKTPMPAGAVSPITYGTWDFGTYVGVGRKLVALEAKLFRWLPGVTDVMFESPWVGPKTHQDVARLLPAMAGLVEMTCEKWRVGCWEVTSIKWRKHFLGVGQLRVGKKGSNREKLKQMAVDRCRVLGYGVQSTDEAEAIGILDYALGFFRAGDVGLPLTSRRRA